MSFRNTPWNKLSKEIDTKITYMNMMTKKKF